MDYIQPIETKYNGYRFRSRLEARWAVFFDNLGVKYEYEPEGFRIPSTYSNAKVYLPDFFLLDFNVYAEVKGSDEQLDADSGKLGDAIDYKSTPMSDTGLILLGPIPYLEGSIPYFDILYWHKGVCVTKCLFDMPGDSPCFEHDEFYRELPESDYWNIYNIYAEFDSGAPLPPSCSVIANYQPWENTCFSCGKGYFENINKCYKAARQARFEHGEIPKVRREK